MPSYQRECQDNTVAVAPATKPKPSGATPISSEPPSTVVGRTHQQIQHALDRFEDDVSPILNGEQSGAITPEGRSEMVHDAAHPALDAINQAEVTTADLASAADDAYKKSRAELSPRAASSLDVLNQQQWWARTSRELDSVPTERVAAACQRLVADADPTELPWAAQELPAYLRSRSVPENWLDSALHQVHPGLRSAADRRKSTAQAAAIIASNARAARRAISQAASGSYHRPRLVDPAKYDPDAVAEPVGAAHGPATRDGYRA
jgi:hypothetical protein